jgi:formate C-acetyltransferase
MLDQLKAHFYLINESGGISHLAPDYEMLLDIGTDGIYERAYGHQKEVKTGTEKWFFYEAAKIIAMALARFGERYAELAKKMAEEEHSIERKKELKTIAKVCSKVPKKGARSFQEAVQSLFFAQIALNLESLDNAISPGRMDQYLAPFYERDVKNGTLLTEGAVEILYAFSIKMSEIIPIFSEHITHFHGGMFNGQVVTIGGLDADGKDATNELSYIFLGIMDALRMRQPNYHARIHTDSPDEFINTINAILAKGGNSPALYNDGIIVETLCRQGYALSDARNYTAVGCVEPVCQGKSFSSTDAALINVPITLEMALNEGRRFNTSIRSGAKTAPTSEMRSMDDVKYAFESQLKFQIKKLIGDLKAIEPPTGIITLPP